MKLLAKLTLLACAGFLADCGSPDANDTGQQTTATQSATPATVTPTANQPVKAAPPTSEYVGADTEKPDAPVISASGAREIGWEDLMPEGEQERLTAMYQDQMASLYSSPIAEGSAGDTMIQIGTYNTVEELNGTKVRIPGYTVPFEYGKDKEVKEFLLVPYFGACIHSPPPPPNQTIFVMSDKSLSLKDLAQAVWIEGTIYTQTQTSELADAAYTIKVSSVEKYEY